MKLCVCGLGHVGAVTAACLAKAGHAVVGVDRDAAKVARVQDGHAPIDEAGLEALIRQMTAREAFSATTDLAAALHDAEATLICIGTAAGNDGALDISAAQRVCDEIGRVLRGRHAPHTVILRSTVPPGACRGTLIPALENAAGRACDDDLGFCYNPAFLRAGSALRDFYCPPCTIVGRDNDQHGSLTAALYAHIVAPLEKTSLETAELLKLGHIDLAHVLARLEAARFKATA